MIDPLISIRSLPERRPGVWRAAVMEDFFDRHVYPTKAGVKAGIAGWTDSALARGGLFYPRGLKSAAGRLEFYSQNFNLVEVDSTYYHLPVARNSQLWVERTPPDFTFNVKAFGSLTKHAVTASALPPAMRLHLPRGASVGTRLRPTDIAHDVMDELWVMFREALLPLHQAGKLGIVLFQFPKWFPRSKANLEYLASLRSRVPEFRVAVEFRQRTWFAEQNRADTLSFLRTEGLVHVVVDEPQGYDASVPLVPEATHPEVAVMRFHGRNGDAWGRRGVGLEEKFRYLYDEGELRSFIPAVQRLRDQAREVHLVFNNCFEDYGIRGARDLVRLLAEDVGSAESDDPS